MNSVGLSEASRPVRRLAALLLVLAGPTHAQRIQLAGAPTVVSVTGGRPVGPVLSLTAGQDEHAVLLGGLSRQQLVVIDRGGASIAAPTNMTELGVAIGAPGVAAFDGPSGLIVADAQSPRWAHLTFVKGKWRADSTGTTNLSRVSSMCSLGARHFVMAKKDASIKNGLIHEVGRVGQVLQSFGEAFSEIDNPPLGYGHVLCVQGAQEVVAVSRFLPGVRAYSLDGRLKWQSELAQFQPIGFEIDGRRMLFALDADSLWDEIASTFSPAAGVIGIQIGRTHGRPGSARYRDLRTMFLSTADGRKIGEQRDLPLVIGAAPSLLYVAEEKQPQSVLIYSYTFKSP